MADRFKRRATVARFHRLQDYETGTSTPAEALDLLDIRSYQIETRVEKGLDIEAVSRISLQKRLQSYSWIPFSLYPDLEVDSVQWSDGTPVNFHRPEDSFDLWLEVGDAPDPMATLDVYYEGDMMDRPQGLWIR